MPPFALLALGKGLELVEGFLEISDFWGKFAGSKLEVLDSFEGWASPCFRKLLIACIPKKER